ncbi:hypothetical protein BKA61DRAFT_577625 [Leptodontidium sp. MPI-SDFR-AT-0119]|nr:hypothetical protein BKA61DRAFT_577625 [Leptodontidium sp. MPI-SDFR-AT-0119]
MMFLQHRTYGLLILIVSTLVRAAYNVSNGLIPRGDLQIRLDYNLARAEGARRAPPTQTSNKDVRNVIFTSHPEFGQDVSAFSDGQLVQMGFNAYEEMLVELARYGFTKWAQPSVMTVFAIGQEIFLAISQKGKGSFMNNFPDSTCYKESEFVPMISQIPLCT